MLLEVFQPDQRVIKLLRNDLGPDTAALRWSIFVFPFAVGKDRYLFHNLTKQCFMVEDLVYDAAVARHCRGLPADDMRKLAARGFLVPEDKDENALFEGIQRLLRVRYASTRLRSYTIMTTTACNARCFYCMEEGARTITMSEDTTEQVIAFILKSHDPSRRVHLRWFGGEPLVAPQVIDRVSAALDSAGIDFDAAMISNGILIDEATVAKMTGPWRIRRIQISLDGQESDYERRKAYRKSYPSAYRTLLSALRRLMETEIQVVLRCNVDGANVDGLKTMVDDLADALPRKQRIYPYFAVLFAQRDSEEHAALFRRCLEAKRYAHEKGFPYIPQAPLHRARRIPCMAEDPYGSTVIGPDGKLYNCDTFSPEMENGDVCSGLVRQDRLQSYLLPEPVADKCRDCLFLPTCTTFSRCPFQIRQCRQVREMELVSDLEMELGRGKDGVELSQSETIDPC